MPRRGRKEQEAIQTSPFVWFKCHAAVIGGGFYKDCMVIPHSGVSSLTTIGTIGMIDAIRHWF